MATIMQKDVLIEVVASGLSAISRQAKDVDELRGNTDYGRLIELRRLLYRTNYEKIDYENTLKECKEIKQKYVG